MPVQRGERGSGRSPTRSPWSAGRWRPASRPLPTSSASPASAPARASVSSTLLLTAASAGASGTSMVTTGTGDGGVMRRRGADGCGRLTGRGHWGSRRRRRRPAAPPAAPPPLSKVGGLSKDSSDSERAVGGSNTSRSIPVVAGRMTKRQVLAASHPRDVAEDDRRAVSAERRQRRPAGAVVGRDGVERLVPAGLEHPGRAGLEGDAGRQLRSAGGGGDPWGEDQPERRGRRARGDREGDPDQGLGEANRLADLSERDGEAGDEQLVSAHARRQRGLSGSGRGVARVPPRRLRRADGRRLADGEHRHAEGHEAQRQQHDADQPPHAGTGVRERWMVASSLPR